MRSGGGARKGAGRKKLGGAKEVTVRVTFVFDSETMDLLAPHKRKRADLIRRRLEGLVSCLEAGDLVERQRTELAGPVSDFGVKMGEGLAARLLKWCGPGGKPFPSLSQMARFALRVDLAAPQGFPPSR